MSDQSLFDVTAVGVRLDMWIFLSIYTLIKFILWSNIKNLIIINP